MQRHALWIGVHSFLVWHESCAHVGAPGSLTTTPGSSADRPDGRQPNYRSPKWLKVAFTKLDGMMATFSRPDRVKVAFSRR